jgi:hypothetical protein
VARTLHQCLAEAELSKTANPGRPGDAKPTELTELAGLPKEDTMGMGKLMLGVAGLAGLTAMGCSAAPPATTGSGSDLVAARDAALREYNGLKLLNGMNTKNGVRSVNGLTSKNGLSQRNGVRNVNGLDDTNGMNTINGLTTRNGVRNVNGLNVNCAGGKTPGVSCTGSADGLLSSTAPGLLSSTDGENVVAYMVRCALTPSQSIQLVDYTGNLSPVWTGELGLAPAWLDGGSDAATYLDADGMEVVSACLMAFTNGRGVHVHIEMNGVGKASSLGGHDTSSGNWFKYQEAAFFGNLFVTPPTSNYCVGKDYVGILSTLGGGLGAVDVRACGGYPSGQCPYASAGDCESVANGITSTGTNEVDAIGTGSNPTNGGCQPGLLPGVIGCAPTGDHACKFVGTSCGLFGCGSSPFRDVTTCSTGSTTWNNVIYTYKLDVHDDTTNAM